MDNQSILYYKKMYSSGNLETKKFISDVIRDQPTANVDLFIYRTIIFFVVHKL
jgi:hypothetical protein